MFESAPLNPPDSIFGLIEKFKKDPDPNKINLSVGVYQDESGTTPVMQAVSDAERRLLAAHGSKNYLPIDGLVEYRNRITRLVLGDALADDEALHTATAQTPGGTVALRVAGELLRRVFDVKKIWISNPTWANHPAIFSAAGLDIEKYGYLDGKGTGFDFEAMAASLENAGCGDAVLLHTVCHNPTGVDPDPGQWQQLGSLIRERKLFPVFDFAYQGFGESIEADAFPIRDFVSRGGEAIVCNSFSKNFGLYGERVGGIMAIGGTAGVAEAMSSQIQLTIRTMYSNPPIHGGAIVNTVLGDPELRQLWESELTEIRQRIINLRHQFVASMQQRLPDHDFSYINRQRGMFSFSGLSGEQVDNLQKTYSIYALRNGRVNIAGINSGNLDRLCDAIASVM